MDGNDSQQQQQGSASGYSFGESYQESPPLQFPDSDPPPDSPGGGGGGGPHGPGWGFGPPMYYPGWGPDRYRMGSRLGGGGGGGGGGGVSDGNQRASGGCAACCCACVLNTILGFVAIAVAFGVYASETMQLGPHSSLLINPNHFFANSIKVVELDAVEGSVLYGFHKTPPLDVVVNWTEAHNVTLPGDTHKDWVYHLNKGSQINVSFTFNSPNSPSIVLAIARGNSQVWGQVHFNFPMSTGREGVNWGKDEFTKWLKNPLDPSTIFSWHIIHENGSFQVSVSTSSAYYIAVGNKNSQVVEVQLHTRIKAFLYNTTEPYYKCKPLDGSCHFPLSFFGGNTAVLTSPGRKSDMADGDWSFKLSYGTRWAIYLVGVGGITVSVLVIYYIIKHCRSTEQDRSRDQSGDVISEREPLLSRKDKDKYIRNAMAGPFRGRKPRVRDEEHNGREECAICLDAPRDCFFIPCGHCVACLKCATRIIETSGICPVCRTQVKDVRKIYTV